MRSYLSAVGLVAVASATVQLSQQSSKPLQYDKYAPSQSHAKHRPESAKVPDVPSWGLKKPWKPTVRKASPYLSVGKSESPHYDHLKRDKGKKTDLVDPTDKEYKRDKGKKTDPVDPVDNEEERKKCETKLEQLDT